MAAITIHSDFGTQENKICHCFLFFPHLFAMKWGDWMPWSSFLNVAPAAKSLQMCLTLCDPIDGSPQGSPVPGILQARTLEWDAISFSNAWKWKVKVKSLSRVRLLATPWTAAYQASTHGIFQARVLEWGAIAFSVVNNMYHKYLLPVGSL